MTPVQPMDVTCSCGRQFRVPTPQAGIRVNVPCPCGAVASAPIRRGGMGGAVCPSCQKSTMIQTREWVDQLAMTRTCDFMCSACGATVEIVGAVGVDLVAAINDYPNKGLVPMGVLSLSVQPPAPVIMPAGSSWFTQPVSVPSGVLTFTPSYDPPREPEPKEPPAPEKIIDGSVIGYRAWRIKDWALTGTFSSVPWVPGINEARCDPGPDDQNDPLSLRALSRAMAAAKLNGANAHPAPHIGCACGITALARFAKTDQHWNNADVYGAIEAWSDEDESETITAWSADELTERLAGYEVVDGPHKRMLKEILGGNLGEVEQHYATARKAGRFILHGTGFRAQYGKVVLLAVDDGWPAAKKAAVRALAQEHGADVCKRSHLEDAAKEHGQLVPDELLEWAKESGCEEASGYLSQLARTPASQSLYTTSQWGSSLGLPGLSPPKPRPGKNEVTFRSPKGVKQTLGYPGPPQGRLTTYRKGDRVRDKKGQVWQCVKGGKPGRWEQEATAE